MSITLKEDKSIRVENYSLRDFIFDVAKAAKSGYSPVDTNDKYVQGFSSWFTCGMVHDDELTDAERAAVGLSVKAYAKGVVEVKTEPKVEQLSEGTQEEPKTVTKTIRTAKKTV